jgi:hypothetical protein
MRSPGSVQIQSICLEHVQGDKSEHRLVGRAQEDARRLAGLMRLQPALGDQAPAIAGNRPGKANCGMGVVRSLPTERE